MSDGQDGEVPRRKQAGSVVDGRVGGGLDDETDGSGERKYAIRRASNGS